jgi:hypothetical protein
MLCPAMTRCMRGGLAPPSTTSLEVRRIPSVHRIHCSHLCQYFFIPIQAPVAHLFAAIRDSSQKAYHPVPVVKSCPVIASEAWEPRNSFSLFSTHKYSVSSLPGHCDNETNKPVWGGSTPWRSVCFCPSPTPYRAQEYPVTTSAVIRQPYLRTAVFATAVAVYGTVASPTRVIVTSRLRPSHLDGNR